ncbi:MAG: hypothetical protein WHS44_10680 [Fimbriimonadales bacterium]|nr:MAG: hypothetical protein KatS3mg018_2282 [Fimbriimonadales bacterium]
MKYRMHKRVETKPDGRKIYYYTFEPVEATHAVPEDSEPPLNANPRGSPREHEPASLQLPVSPPSDSSQG